MLLYTLTYLVQAYNTQPALLTRLETLRIGPDWTRWLAYSLKHTWLMVDPESWDSVWRCGKNNGLASVNISATHVHRCGLILTSDPVEMVIMREASTEPVRNEEYLIKRHTVRIAKCGQANRCRRIRIRHDVSEAKRLKHISFYLKNDGFNQQVTKVLIRANIQHSTCTNTLILSLTNAFLMACPSNRWSILVAYQGQPKPETKMIHFPFCLAHTVSHNVINTVVLFTTTTTTTTTTLSLLLLLHYHYYYYYYYYYYTITTTTTTTTTLF